MCRYIHVYLSLSRPSKSIATFIYIGFGKVAFQHCCVMQPIIRVHAIDNDLGDNGRLNYEIDTSITTTQVLNSFIINRSTGEVSLARRLDAGKVARYAVPIIARDSAQRSLTGVKKTDLLIFMELNFRNYRNFFSQAPPCFSSTLLISTTKTLW